MIVKQKALGEVRSAVGTYLFTCRKDQNHFQAVRPNDVVRENGSWAFLSLDDLEFHGDFVVKQFKSPREIPVVVDFDHVNELFSEAEIEITWEEKQEMDELLKEY